MKIILTEKILREDFRRMLRFLGKTLKKRYTPKFLEDNNLYFGKGTNNENKLKIPKDTNE